MSSWAGARSRFREFGSRWRSPAAIAAAAYVALSFALFSRSWADPGHRYIGLPGDPIEEIWLLRWFSYAAGHLQDPLFTTHLNYPSGASLMWFAPPLPGLLMWPVTVSIGPVVAYNLILTLSVAASAWCMFLALRRITGDVAGAAVGGAFYGFSPFVIAHALAHASVALAVGPPLLLMALHEGLIVQRNRAWITGVAIGSIAAAQLWLFPEGLAVEALAFVVCVPIVMALNRERVRTRAGHALRALAHGALSFLMLAAPALIAMFAGPQSIRGAVVHPPDIFVSDLLNFVVPAHAQLWSPDWALTTSARFTGNPYEWSSYLGLPLLALVALTAAQWWRRPLVRFATLSALAMAVLSLGPHLHVAGAISDVPLPAGVLARLPLLGSLLPVRVGEATDLFVAILVAVFVIEVRRLSRPVARAGGVLLGGLCLLTLLPPVPFPAGAITTPEFFTTSSVNRIPEGSVALIAPYTLDGRADEPQLWQAMSGMRFRLPSGYVFAASRPEQGPDRTALSDQMEEIRLGIPPHRLSEAMRRQYAADLARWRAETVIVGPMPHRSEMVAFLSAVLGEPPEAVGGVQVWWHPSVRPGPLPSPE